MRKEDNNREKRKREKVCVCERERERDRRRQGKIQKERRESKRENLRGRLREF